MKKIKSTVALLLCFILLIPSYTVQGALEIPEETISMDDVWIDDLTDSSSDIEQSEYEMIQEEDLAAVSEESVHYQETVSLEPLPVEDSDWDGDLTIYWNPSGDAVSLEIPAIASSSQASRSNSSSGSGSDHENGLTPQTAVRSLNTAIRRAEKLGRQQGVEVSDITIQAMSTMVISQDMKYTVRGRGVHITSWEGRNDGTEMIFAVDQGELSLHNMVLEPSDAAILPADAPLIYVRAGKVQLGEKVESYGSFVLDYTQEYENFAWSSLSEAAASGSEAGASSEPIVELLKQFEPASEYVLDLLVPSERESVMAVRALYSDSQPADEFMEAFILAEDNTEDWSLSVEERIGGVLRDTTDEEDISATAAEATGSEVLSRQAGMARNADLELTQKSLVAIRGAVGLGETVYWNPGNGIDLDGDGAEEYPAGNDKYFDGTKATAPVRSWWKALELAKGGTIICMQTVDLSSAQADTMSFTKHDPDEGIYGQYLDNSGNFVLDGKWASRVTLSTWSERGAPVLRVPDGTSVILKNITLAGDDSSDAQLMIAEGGQIILEKNVVTGSEAYIQVDLDELNQAKDHPLIVNDSDVRVMLYFGGVNDSIKWNYQDVVIAGENLIDELGDEQAGTYLLEHISLHNGNVMFDWTLRKDTDEDQDGGVYPSHLELYKQYYFNAVYLDGERGDDNNYGASCNSPVRSFAKAKVLLEEEMTKSLAARQAAADNGESWNVYALPSTIYICGTVMVEDVQSWTLPVYTDIDGTPIQIKIKAHLSTSAEPSVTLHAEPDVLVHVKGEHASLTLGSGLMIVNNINKSGNVNTCSITVDEKASLILQENSELSGLTNSEDLQSRTIGSHIYVGFNPKTNTTTSGILKMEPDWSGSIHSKQYAIRAYGSASRIQMESGKIWNHYNNAGYQAGIYLRDAVFTMSGGSISDNSSTSGGAGVYLDTGSTFHMKKGAIERNSTISTSTNLVYGIGVYIRSSASFYMGISGSSDHEECRISDQRASGRYQGVGVYIAAGGNFTMLSGMISGNKGKGASGTSSISYGGGVCNIGSLVMEGGVITDNGSDFSETYIYSLGGGIYLGGTNQVLTGGTISYNQTGRHYTASHNNTGGGGLYVIRSAKIENLIIEGNRSHYGAGMTVVYGNSSYQLELSNCTIRNNISTTQSIASTPTENVTEYGYGGGLYLYNVNTEMKGMTISENRAATGGGAYFYGYTVKVTDSLFHGNAAFSQSGMTGTINGSGGGISNQATLHLTDVTLSENQAKSYGGGVYSTSILYCQRTNILNNKSYIEGVVDGGGGIYSANHLYMSFSTIQGNYAASSGGGLCVYTYSTYRTYLSDVEVTGNVAKSCGGGVYSSNTLYVNEQVAGATKWSDNQARYGGGIYHHKGNAYFDSSGIMENEAVGDNAQGANVYITQAGRDQTVLYLINSKGLELNTMFKLQQIGGGEEGVYNIFLNASGVGEAKVVMDPQTVAIDTENAAFLNKANNYIAYIKNPLQNASFRLPISVNVDVFKVGSIIARPANLANISMERVNSQGNGSESYAVTFFEQVSNNYRNAATTEGLTYTSGGILPERTYLGGYKDFTELTNIIILGEGVYLDGEKGSDVGRDGRTPETAVKTFGKAKTLLEQYTDTANQGNNQGFAPFIYICGTVTVTGNATWNLSATEDRYLADSKYRQMELAAGRNPESVQLRRFASFTRKSMVSVQGVGSTLTMTDLSMNGMADAVLLDDSAVEAITINGAKLILKDRAHIYNNYKKTIVVTNGQLQVSSDTEDSDDFTNQQIEVGWGDGVELFGASIMEMDGYASMLFPNNPISMTSPSSYANLGNVSRGVLIQEGSQLTMKEDSKLSFTDDSQKMNSSYAFGVVIGNTVAGQSQSKVSLSGRAMIRGCYAAIGLLDFDTEVKMADDSKLKDNYYGIYSESKVRSGLFIELGNNASIYTSGESASSGESNSGISFYNTASLYAEGSAIEIKMKDNSSIYNMGYDGIRTNYIQAKQTVTMTEHASIYNNGGGGLSINSGYSQVSVQMTDDSLIQQNKVDGVIISNIEKEVFFTMGENSRIVQNKGSGVRVSNNRSAVALQILKNSRVEKNTEYGVAIAHTSAKVTLNMSGGDENQNERSLIQENEVGGIYVGYTTQDVDLVMGKNSQIIDNKQYGIQMDNTKSAITVSMKENSQIGNNGYGIYALNGSVDALTINMIESALINDNENAGICMKYGNRGLNVNMSGNSRIGATSDGVTMDGIYLEDVTLLSGVNDRTDHYNINMTGNAVIGGDGGYNSSTERRGNSRSGIYSYIPFSVTMDENAKITYNQDSGIYFRYFSSDMFNNDYYFKAKTKVKMMGNSLIANSNYGIYSTNKILLNGMYDSERFESYTLSDHASIRNTVYGNVFLTEAELFMLGDASILAPSADTENYYALNLNGTLYMDGTVTIEGMAYLLNGYKALTLLSPIPLSDPAGKYRLHLSEGYVGQIVIQPGGSLTDVTAFTDNFFKVKGDGIAEERALTELVPNIVLTGENNIYLSSWGQDFQNGSTPTTAVRTFKRAKELLETGYYSDGADIIICTVPGKLDIPYQINVGDEEWGFETGGYLTNLNSNDTWKPVIRRHEKFYGIMLYLGRIETGDRDQEESQTPAKKILLKNITIDGKGDIQEILEDQSAAKEILKITQETSAVVGVNAILQNNKRDMKNVAAEDVEHTIMGIYVEEQGTLLLEGGVIQDLQLLKHRNTKEHDLGVAIYNLGTVQIDDGKVQNNHLTTTENEAYQYHSGVIVNKEKAIFVMNGGTIKENSSSPSSVSDSSLSGGGIVVLDHAQATINDGLISNNKGGAGAGIYYDSDQILELAGGRITGNQSFYQGIVAMNSPVYIGSNQFVLKGGSAVVDDPIYLDSINHIITLSGNIYQTSRRYHVYVNSGAASDQFKKSSIVVKPDGNYMTDISQYLVNFDVRANGYIADRGKSSTRLIDETGILKENSCIILMQAVFLDADSGNDANNGSTPLDAVASFQQAKIVGEGDGDTGTKDYFVIYFSGVAKPLNGEVWELGDISYMCRYTGFTVYQPDGSAVTQIPLAHYGYLIEPQGLLELKGIHIYGRRTIDGTANNGDSMIHIRNSSQVVIGSGTVLSRNYNQGSYMTQLGPVALGMRGGAVLVEAGGLLRVNGGTITEVDDQHGTAIYQKAVQNAASTDFGRVQLDQSPYIEGGCYLAGWENGAEAYLEVTEQYIPGDINGVEESISIHLQNERSGRPVVVYLNGYSPTVEQIGYFALDDSITAVYDLINNIDNESILELQMRQVLYVDGQNGDDSQTGENPQQAVKTLKGIYTRVKDMEPSTGVLIFVVDTIDIAGRDTLVNERYEQNGQMYYRGIYSRVNTSGQLVEEIEIDSQVYFKRYAKPPATTASGFEKETLRESLFYVQTGGQFVIKGIFVDGHSQISTSSTDYLAAPGVVANAPLITVAPGGFLEAGSSDTEIGEEAGNSFSNQTLISNNYNDANKTKVLGQNEAGEDIYEASSAGIEILSDSNSRGKASLTQVEFKNLTLGEGVNGGSDIYQNGELTVQEKTAFTGSVFLEGMGSPDNPDSSCYLEAGKYGTPFRANFNLLMRDPYASRKVVVFPSYRADGPPDADLGYFLLEDHVDRYYSLRKRAVPEMHVLELAIPTAVYLDGQFGSDSNTGYVPTEPVKTLKRAYECLKTRGGKILYVMGTVEINEDTNLSGSQYQTDGSEVNLLVNNERLDVRRFVRPKAGDLTAGLDYNPSYDKDDYLGTLFKVADDVTLTLKKGLYFDGHYSERSALDDPIEFYVNHTTEVLSPLIEVQPEGELEIGSGVVMEDNHNTKIPQGTENRIDGGAISNKGRVELSGGKIWNNNAEKGAGIYQAGEFEIISNPSGIEGQEIYLMTEPQEVGVGSMWGEDHVLDIAVWLDEDIKLDLNMDRAVAGRPVVRYTSHTAVDAQWESYNLGSLVPNELFLVESSENDFLLELQDWRVLDINVPEEVFLIVRKSEMIDLRDGASNGREMADPVYTVKNNGQYPAKVSLSGFMNQNTEAGITGYDVINLVASPSDAADEDAARQDLYLAISGTDQSDSFSAMPETSLYDFVTEGQKIQEMGILASGTEAEFEFIVSASEQFINYYADSSFPLTGSNATKEYRMAYLRHKNQVTGVTSANRARAKYRMTYRVELVPPRR